MTVGYLGLLDEEAPIIASCRHCGFHPTVGARMDFSDLKSGWVVSRVDIDSDPQRWADLLLRMQSVKECCEKHHSKMVAVVVSDELKDLPIEVVSTFRVRFGLDERALASLLAINVDPNDPTVVQLANNELKSIGHMVLENVWAMHQAHGQRIILKSSQRIQPNLQLQVLDNCKVLHRVIGIMC